MRTVLGAAVVACAAVTAAAQPAKPEIVCDLTTLVSGRMDGRTFRGDGPSPESAKPMRLTFRGHDQKAGTARMIVGDGPAEETVGMTSDKGSIVYLHEEPGFGKLMVSTQAKATPDGWPAVASRHEWASGDLSLKVMTGFCRARIAR